MDLARLSGLAVAGGRSLLGVVAIARPELPLRPWVGAVAADSEPPQLLARALGGRDLALGLGALWALTAGADRSASAVWLAAGAVADAVDVSATLAAWRRLPAGGRAMVAAAAAGGTIAGAYGAVRLRSASS
jgi:hypothetical protein